MKQKIISLCLLMVAICMTQSCCFVNPSYDEEVAFKKKPIMFGSTGVDKEACTSFTLYVPTTTAVTFNMLPKKYEFKFDDLLSNDNTPLDVSMYMILKIKNGETPDLLANYGENWYATFIEPYFKNKVREYVSAYSPFDLMSNREVLKEFDQKLASEMQNYISEMSKKKNFPIDVQQIITDRVMPNKNQLEEMNRTAAAIQAKQTQEKKAEMELARAKAETQRALADKAYMEQMHLSPEQYIQLKWIDVVNSKSNANIDVMVGACGDPIWDIKRK